jgi:hypothetical protein
LEQFEDRITPVASLFTAQAPITTSNLTNNGCVAVADFNKDGFPDVVMTNFGIVYGSTPGLGVGNSITIMRGQAGGGFPQKISLNSGGTNPSFVTVADLNGDGWPDLVVTNENGQNTGSFSIFKNNGAGSLSLAGTYSTASNNPSGVAVADVTGDGVPDVIVCSFGKDDGTGNNVVGQGITIFQQNVDPVTNKGNFNFTGGQIAFPNPGVAFIPTSLVVADFDGDGFNDIAATVPDVPADTTSPQPPGLVYIFKGNGVGGFTQLSTLQSGGVLPVNIQAADINGDGLPDLIVSNAGDPHSTSPEFSGNAVGTILNTSSPGNPSFDFTNSITANCHGTFATAIADFNKDGKADIAAINYGSQPTETLTTPAFVSVYLGTGNGVTFTPPTPSTFTLGTKSDGTPVYGGQYLAAGDFDGNGAPDLIVGTADDYTSGSITNVAGLLYNNTTAAPTVTSLQINDGSVQRSEVRSIQVTFSTQVTFAGTGTVNQNAAAAFQLQHMQNLTSVANLQASVDNSSGKTVVTLSFTTTGNAITEVDPVSIQGTANSVLGPSLADGRYQLTIFSNKVSANGQALNGGGPSGNYVTPTEAVGSTGLHLWRLFGDVTGDGVNDPTDLNTFRLAFNTNNQNPGSGYLAFLDANNDGVIDPTDLNQYRTRFNTNIFN